MKRLHGAHRSDNINTEKLEKVKISVLFSFILLLSSICGILIANYISSELYANSVFNISTHFETAFLKASGVIDAVKIIAIYSLPDILSVLIIFAASFSVFNYIITDIALVYNGIGFGISSAFLINFSKKSGLPYTLGHARLWLFIMIDVAILSVLLYYSYQSALSSVSFRYTDKNGRPSIKTKDILTFALKTAACVGGIFILKSLYCFLLYILK